MHDEEDNSEEIIFTEMQNYLVSAIKVVKIKVTV